MGILDNKKLTSLLVVFSLIEIVSSLYNKLFVGRLLMHFNSSFIDSIIFCYLTSTTSLKHLNPIFLPYCLFYSFSIYHVNFTALTFVYKLIN